MTDSRAAPEADPVLADDGYPSEQELGRIRDWPAKGEPSAWGELMAYVRRRWKYADSGYWHEDDGEYQIATCGWSGNEELVAALRDNRLFWLVCWQQSRRSGRHTFAVPAPARPEPEDTR